jgi:hypothetical protein
MTTPADLRGVGALDSCADQQCYDTLVTLQRTLISICLLFTSDIKRLLHSRTDHDEHGLPTEQARQV